jgi:hypothetical protein
MQYLKQNLSNYKIYTVNPPHHENKDYTVLML